VRAGQVVSWENWFVIGGRGGRGASGRQIERHNGGRQKTAHRKGVSQVRFFAGELDVYARGGDAFERLGALGDTLMGPEGEFGVFGAHGPQRSKKKRAP